MQSASSSFKKGAGFGMSIVVRVPSSMRQLTGGKTEIEVVASTIAECVDKLEDQFPGIKDKIYDDQGELRRTIGIFVNGDDIRFLEKLATLLKPGDEVGIIPAFAGG